MPDFFVVVDATTFQLTERSQAPDHAEDYTGSLHYEYDEEDNLSRKHNGQGDNKHQHLFDYDPAGRLREIKIYDGSGNLSETINYDYDGDGNRVKQKVGNQTRYFLYSGSKKILELDAVKQVTAYYVYGADGIVYRRKVSGEYEYHHKDWLGGTTLITDDSQNVVASYFYDVFGAPRWSLASVTDNEHLFTGKEFDASTNLYYLIMRYYDPHIARFNSRDPAFDGINWYIYVENNPLVFVDPSGEARRFPGDLRMPVGGGAEMVEVPSTPRHRDLDSGCLGFYRDSLGEEGGIQAHQTPAPPFDCGTDYKS